MLFTRRWKSAPSPDKVAATSTCSYTFGSDTKPYSIGNACKELTTCSRALGFACGADAASVWHVLPFRWGWLHVAILRPSSQSAVSVSRSTVHIQDWNISQSASTDFQCIKLRIISCRALTGPDHVYHLSHGTHTVTLHAIPTTWY